eukprot:scaffold24995_cov46-Attheya_sp.AAC.3
MRAMETGTVKLSRSCAMVDQLRMSGWSLGSNCSSLARIICRFCCCSKRGTWQERLGTATENDLWRESESPEFAHAVLGGLGLLLTVCASQEGHQADKGQTEVVVSDAELELAQGLEEDAGLNVAHRASHLDEANVSHRGFPRGVGGGRNVSHALQRVLDLVGNVWHHLHGLAQKVPAALLGNDVAVHFPRGDVVVRGEFNVQEALVVAQVQVRLAPVVQHKHFAVLERTHRAGVHVQVRVDLDGRHPVPAALQQPAQRRDGHALSQAAHHSSRHHH